MIIRRGCVRHILTFIFLLYLGFSLVLLRYMVAPPTEGNTNLLINELGLVSLISSVNETNKTNVSQTRKPPQKPKLGMNEDFFMWDYDIFMEKTKKPFRNISILMWTQYYHNKDLTDHVRNEAPIPEWCNVTFDKDVLSKSQAVVFHIPGSDLDLKDLPPRNPKQLWVFYIIEPPIYMNRQTQPLNKLFNRTMTYRLDSDYPCPYGFVKHIQPPLKVNPYMETPGPEWGNKKKLVASMVSHCGTFSKREIIVSELKKHVSVDVYGSCGTLRCDKRQEEGCYRKLGLTYKFYLSFENSLCTDYITEKFSNALRYHMVPIVYGGGNYSQILPHPKSFIDLSDFGSVRSLAEYLLYLDNNHTAYAEYFEWKRYYEIEIRQGFAGFRRMCYALQAEKEPKHKVYDNIANWWVQKGACKTLSKPHIL